MSEIDLEPHGYRETGRHSALVIRRGWRKWLYFARHPILAFVAYQKAYPDSPEEAQAFRERQTQAITFALGKAFLLRLIGH